MCDRLVLVGSLRSGGSAYERFGRLGEKLLIDTAQGDHSFAGGALSKHGNMGHGTYVDPARVLAPIAT